VTEDELAITPGAIATRSEEHPVHEPANVVFTPQDFRLNLQARLKEPVELTDLDQPSIRKLTWEQVVPEKLEPAEKPVPQASGTLDDAITDEVVEVADAPAAAASSVVAAPETPAPSTPAVAEAAAPQPNAPAASATPAAAAPVPAPAATVPPPPPPAPKQEVNTLASVPDMVVDDSPIELPQITPSSGHVVAPAARSVYTPVLPETLFAVSPRPTPPNMAAIVAESNAAWHRATRKHKRHFFRRFFSLVVVLGLLGGGAYAGKMYLQRQPKWPTDIKPLATDVATSRGLHWKASVAVTPLPAEQYAQRLATALVAASADDAASWRAFGVLNGELDLQAIGTQAMSDAPAFYEPASKSVLVTADLSAYEHLYRFAVHRALASALLDQKFQWSSRLQTASPATAFALRATIDADALNVANSLAAQDAPDQLAPELLSFVQAHGGAASPSQYAALIAGRAGAVLRSTVATMNADALTALEQATPASDAMLDAARPETALPAVPGTKGLMFWYYVLASRIDDTQAWAAAVHWTGDSVVANPSATGQCFDAQVTAGDAAGANVMVAAFQAWAGAAPKESATTVTTSADNQVAIHACDPGAAATAALPVKVPVAFGGAAVERALVDAAASAAAQTKVDAACLITAARQRNTPLASPSDDAPVIAVDWKPSYVDANLDLAAGCVAASG
jgi:hypothetical protein